MKRCLISSSQTSRYEIDVVSIIAKPFREESNQVQLTVLEEENTHKWNSSTLNVKPRVLTALKYDFVFGSFHSEIIQSKSEKGTRCVHSTEPSGRGWWGGG